MNDPRAIILDLDGVITDTAEVHFRAWKRMFDAFLQDEANAGERHAFSEADYRAHVDGKPRYDGVRDFLASRDITLPEGATTDDPDQQTVRGLGNRKNRYFQEVIERDGVSVFDDARRQLTAWRSAGLPLAIVSSSRNCAMIVEQAGLAEFFDARVDGVTGREAGLDGKPAPDYFTEAARLLDVPPAAAAVFEDAVAGVQAGRAGEFGWVVGVARHGNADELRSAGADLIVTQLDEFDSKRRALD